MKITVETLKDLGAYCDQVDLFASLHPNGLELPSRGERRAEVLRQAGRDGLDVGWWLRTAKQSGVVEHWCENGQLKYRWEYKNGKLHGVVDGWHSNGKQWYRREYKDGEFMRDLMEAK